MTRIAMLLGLALSTVGGCAADRDVGAVVVRWRLAEAASGQLGGCTVGTQRDGLTVDQIVLDIRQLDGTEVPCDSCVFGCGPLEGTTHFTIPANRTYLFQLRAIARGCPVGFAPPPVTRSVRPGEVTNLNAVEILIPPCERAVCDGGGAVSGGCDAS